MVIEPSPEVELVEGDERRIRQVVFNLLSNAVKLTPEGGSVDVRSARRGRIPVRSRGRYGRDVHLHLARGGERVKVRIGAGSTR